MTQLIATIWKELLHLGRDRSGLLVLFVMPAVLVLVITLVQDNTMKAMGETDTEILFIDNDRDLVGRHMETALTKADGIRLVKVLDGRAPDRQVGIQSVAKGDYQLCLVVPDGISAAVSAGARKAALHALSSDQADLVPVKPAAEIEVYFDPTVMGGYRAAVNHLLQLILLQIEVQEKMSYLSELLPEHIQNTMKEKFGPMASGGTADDFFSLKMQWQPDALLKVRALSAMGKDIVKTPDAVQQNVPAWALFGIFFIVLPMAGSFIKERMWGVEHRILSMPVSYLTIVTGKVCAYTLVCLVQFALILFIGKAVLPVLGTAPFELGSSAMAAAAVALAAILAATAYGILLGTAVKSYEQASMFGPISIVIAAALGGIMVPVYAMPVFMQRLSVVSPLAWAQNAFLELFARGGTLESVLPQIALLFGFSLACIAVAWFLFFRRLKKGAC